MTKDIKFYYRENSAYNNIVNTINDKSLNKKIKAIKFNSSKQQFDVDEANKVYLEMQSFGFENIVTDYTVSQWLEDQGKQVDMLNKYSGYRHKRRQAQYFTAEGFNQVLENVAFDLKNQDIQKLALVMGSYNHPTEELSDFWCRPTRMEEHGLVYEDHSGNQVNIRAGAFNKTKINGEFIEKKDVVDIFNFMSRPFIREGIETIYTMENFNYQNKDTGENKVALESFGINDFEINLDYDKEQSKPKSECFIPTKKGTLVKIDNIAILADRHIHLSEHYGRNSPAWIEKHDMDHLTLSDYNNKVNGVAEQIKTYRPVISLARLFADGYGIKLKK